MGDRVLLSVLLKDTVPPRYEDRAVEMTATPGLYVSEHPDGIPGWVLVLRCGVWLASYVRWRTPEAAHQVARALGDEGIDWTLATATDLLRAYPDYSGVYWAVAERFQDLRLPMGQGANIR